jgi:hypothetical protein
MDGMGRTRQTDDQRAPGGTNDISTPATHPFPLGLGARRLSQPFPSASAVLDGDALREPGRRSCQWRSGVRIHWDVPDTLQYAQRANRRGCGRARHDYGNPVRARCEGVTTSEEAMAADVRARAVLFSQPSSYAEALPIRSPLRRSALMRVDTPDGSRVPGAGGHVNSKGQHQRP